MKFITHQIYRFLTISNKMIIFCLLVIMHSFYKRNIVYYSMFVQALKYRFLGIHCCSVRPEFGPFWRPNYILLVILRLWHGVIGQVSSGYPWSPNSLYEELSNSYFKIAASWNDPGYFVLMLRFWKIALKTIYTYWSYKTLSDCKRVEI